MDDKQTKAMKRLLKRLSALRKTLRKDERDLLDSLIVRSSSDVHGHADLTGADTMGADSTGADTMGADNTGADTTGADTTGADTANQDWDIGVGKDGYKF